MLNAERWLHCRMPSDQYQWCIRVSILHDCRERRPFAAGLLSAVKIGCSRSSERKPCRYNSPMKPTRSPIFHVRCGGIHILRADTYRRCPSGNPSSSAFWRKAPAVRLVSFEIFATAVFARE
jgi:hypothetical protein